MVVANLAMMLAALEASGRVAAEEVDSSRRAIASGEVAVVIDIDGGYFAIVGGLAGDNIAEGAGVVLVAV